MDSARFDATTTAHDKNRVVELTPRAARADLLVELEHPARAQPRPLDSGAAAAGPERVVLVVDVAACAHRVGVYIGHVS